MLPTPTEEDVAWAEARVDELTLEGYPTVEAVTLAATECTTRVLERQEHAQRAHAKQFTSYLQSRVDFAGESAEERRRYRESLLAKAAMPREAAEKPTLHVTLGDMIAAKKERS